MKYTGFLLVLFSSICFGVMPIFATFAYQTGLSVSVVLLFRFLLAAILLNLYVLIKGYKYPTGKTLIILIMMGGVGYATQSFLYFTALTLIGSSLTAILLYLYPAIVLLLSIFLLNTKIKKIEIIALILAMIGALLVIGIKFEQMNYIGILFGIGAAFVYSIYILAGSKVMQGIHALVGATVIISSASVVYLLFTLSAHATMPATTQQWTWVFAIAMVSGILAIVTFFSGMKIVGPVKASMISTFEPVVTVYLSYLLLHDTITRYQILGAILIITAAILISKEGNHE